MFSKEWLVYNRLRQAGVGKGIEPFLLLNIRIQTSPVGSTNTGFINARGVERKSQSTQRKVQQFP